MKGTPHPPVTMMLMILMALPLKGEESLRCTLEGSIRDLETMSPLPGANVILEGTTLGAASDLEGHFVIRQVPAGSYTLRIDMMGYKAQARANVQAIPNRSNVLNFLLEPAVLSGQDVVVTAGFFERAKDAAVSVRTVDFEEIQSDPVGSHDILSMMQSLPSVVSGADQTNEIIVRGGAPGENLFVMDHLDIPYPVHYPSQGAGGGPITMVNTEFIDRIDFFAGAFPARYGDKLSSVMDVTVREGSRDTRETTLGMNMSGFGATLEGPLSEKTTYLASIQRSFLDLVIARSGLMSVPEYWTFQGKVTYHLDRASKLMLNYLGGIDAIDIVNEKSMQARGADNVLWDSQQHTLGMTYHHLYSDAGYLITSLGVNHVQMQMDVFRDLEGVRNRDIYQGLDVEQELIWKGDVVHRFRKDLEWSLGAKLKGARAGNTSDYHGGELVLWGYAPDSMSAAIPVDRSTFFTDYYDKPNTVVRALDTLAIIDPVHTDQTRTLGSGGLYSQLRWQPRGLWELTLGGRLEYAGYIRKFKLSPRLNLGRHLSPQLKINLAGGRYFQPPFYYQYVRFGKSARKLDFYSADQASLGCEWLAREDLRVTVEGYWKEFRGMIERELLQDPNSGADSLGDDLVNTGSGRSRGVEFFLQKKYSHNWYTTFSYAYSISEGVDVRRSEKTYYPWDYDYRHVLNLIGGVKIRYMEREWYQRWRQTWLSAATSWIPIAPSDEYEISFRLRYSGGRPYTPKEYNHLLRKWYTYADEEWNGARHDPYLRFDLMLLQRFYGSKVNLVTFWDIMNVFDRDNPWDWMYYDDGTRELALQFKSFPVGGITLEF